MKKHQFEHDLDHPLRTVEHRDLILSNKYLKKTYQEWYSHLLKALPEMEGDILEIGSGGGFLKEMLPSVITSDILPLDYCDACFSAEKLPYSDKSLSAIMMVNVLHHIPNPENFFSEAQRCLKPGGKILLIEPTSTPLSRFFYKKIHHEPFDDTAFWNLEPGSPLSNSNQAIPWIIMKRDRAKFDLLFPELQLVKYQKLMPFNNVLSGGLSWHPLLPLWMYSVVRFFEVAFSPFVSLVGLFAFSIVEKK